jgi:hypothetical protein
MVTRLFNDDFGMMQLFMGDYDFIYFQDANLYGRLPWKNHLMNGLGK